MLNSQGYLVHVSGRFEESIEKMRPSIAMLEALDAGCVAHLPEFTCVYSWRNVHSFGPSRISSSSGTYNYLRISLGPLD